MLAYDCENCGREHRTEDVLERFCPDCLAIQDDLPPPRQCFDPIVARVPQIFDEAKALLLERGQQYGGNQVNDYMPFGVLSYVQMVHVKAARLVSITKLDKPKQELKDSALDIINYAAFLLAYLEGQE